MTKYTLNELCLIWLDSFTGLEYKHKLKLYKTISGKTDIRKIIENNSEYIISNLSKSEYEVLLSSANGEYLNSVIAGLERKGIVAVTMVSESYPELLKQTDVPPLVLYTKGDISLLKDKCFSVVGSRKSLPLSIKICQNVCRDLVLGGLTLVTGIAEGVDSAVINSALDNQGKVIVVLASGIDNIYPKCNVGLVDKVIQKGLVISEYPPEVVTRKYFYLVRNRIIAGISKGTLVVSGALKSGTLNTANYTLEYNRDLFSIPYNLGIESGAGCNKLIKEGANLVESAEDILSVYGLKVKEKKKIALNDLEVQIVSAINSNFSTVEKLCNKLNKQVYEVSPVLAMLEIKGAIIKNGVNTYAVCREFLEE